MAEPASIYDPDKKEPMTRPDSEALEDGGETSPPSGDLSAAPGPAQSTNGGTTDPHQVGRGYRPDNPEELTKLKPSVRGVIGFAKTNRGKIIIGGAAAGFVTLLIVGFFILLPFKILHIVNNLQNRFFATSENAVQRETDVLFSDYVRKHVLPGLNTCKGSTIDKSCTPKAIQGDSMISNLYKGWRTAGLENKMAGKYGLEFKKVGTNFYIKTPELAGDGVSLGDETTGFMKSGETLDDFIANDGRFQKVGRAQLRQNYRNSLQNETKWKQVMYRYKVGGLLAGKYGLKRCIIACTTRDNFADWKDNKTRAAKMIIAERVLAPRSEILRLVVECVISNDPACDPNNRRDTGSDGRRQSNVQTRLQADLATLAASNTGKYADVLAHSNGVLKDGYKKYLVKAVARKIAGGSNDAIDKLATEKVAGNLVPIIGWVNTASGMVNTLEHAGPKIKALSYATNAAAMVSLYTTYRVFADEIKTGNIDPAILGSFNDALGPGDKTTLGGTASAEGAPLYASLVGGASTPSSGSSSYTCNDGKPVPAGQQICQEEVLGGNTSAVTDTINGVLGSLGPLKDLAGFWNGTAGTLIRPFIKAATYMTNSALSFVPYYPDLVEKISDAAQPIISSLTDWAIPSPFSDNMSGGRTFHMMAGGADVSGNDYAQNGLGGKALFPDQVAAIVNEQTQQNIQDYKSQPFFARIFDTNSEYSLVSRVAVAMPSNWGSAWQTIASFFSDPFGRLGHSFMSIFISGHAFAAAAAQPDPFGITQYGYPADDPNLAAANADPEKYWTENCSSDGTTLDWQDPKKVNFRWQDTAVVDNTNGQYKNTTTNPCLLLQAAAGSAGALYDSNLLTPEDTSN